MKWNTTTVWCTWCTAMLPAMHAFAQVDSMRLHLTSARELLQLDSGHYHAPVSTSIADLHANEPREAPGAVTVITARQIAAAGARDLQEALALVPGFSFARDVDDVVATSIRGNWASEGKCLYMLNGTTLNEISYGTFGLGQRIPLSNVSRIEVITGPGSVIYGGFAALGVVNIVTKDSQEFDGSEAVVQAGMSNGRMSKAGAQVFGSHHLGDKAEISYAMSAASDLHSTGTWVLPDGRHLSFGDSTRAGTHQFMAVLRAARTRAQFYFDDRTSAMSEAVHTLVQRDLLLDLEHTLDLSERATLTLRTAYRDQLPWNYSNDTLTGYVGTNDQRWSHTVLLRHKPLRWLGLLTGLSGYTEMSRQLADGATFRTSGTQRMRAADLALFAEAHATGRWGRATLGVRAEKSSFSDLVMAPRVAWTKAGRHLHGKLLYSTAYRLPTFQNVEVGPADGRLHNEWVFTTEVEAGWRSDLGTECIVNLFQVDIRHPIVYAVAEDGSEYYFNRARAATNGVEVKLRHTTRKLFLTLTYGNYQVARALSDLPEVELPAPHQLAYLSAARHKLGAMGEWNASEQVSIGSRLAWQSAAWSYQYTAASNDSLELVEHRNGVVVDLGLRYRPRVLPGFSARIGLRDAFAQSPAILSPYANGLTPIPSSGRGISVELHYSLSR